jgi:4-hydroxybenzoate polyprenyltransferase
MLKYLRLMRPLHWYKNLVIFIAIIFSQRFFMYEELALTFLGFVALCLVSSANYIINDIADRQEDRLHPVKKKRPIAAGRISPLLGGVLAGILLVMGISLSWFLGSSFVAAVIAIFMLNQVYTFWLRDEAIADLIMIGINFVLRAAAGALLISVEISPWLVICAFFFAVFLAGGKRKAELVALKKPRRKVYQVYDYLMLDRILTATIAILIMSFALYTFVKASEGAIYSLPLVVYALFRYQGFVDSGSGIAQQPELVFTDVRMDIAFFLWCALIFLSLYVIS